MNTTKRRTHRLRPLILLASLSIAADAWATCVYKPQRVVQFSIVSCSDAASLLEEAERPHLYRGPTRGTVMEVVVTETRLLAKDNTNVDVASLRLAPHELQPKKYFTGEACDAFAVGAVYRAIEDYACCDVSPPSSLPCALGVSTYAQNIIAVEETSASKTNKSLPALLPLRPFAAVSSLVDETNYREWSFIKTVGAYLKAGLERKATKLLAAVKADEQRARKGELTNQEINEVIRVLSELGLLGRAERLIPYLQHPMDDPIERQRLEAQVQRLRDHGRNARADRLAEKNMIFEARDQAWAAIARGLVRARDYDRALEFALRVESPRTTGYIFNTLLERLLTDPAVPDADKDSIIQGMTESGKGASFALFRYLEHKGNPLDAFIVAKLFDLPSTRWELFWDVAMMYAQAQNAEGLDRVLGALEELTWIEDPGATYLRLDTFESRATAAVLFDLTGRHEESRRIREDLLTTHLKIRADGGPILDISGEIGLALYYHPPLGNGLAEWDRVESSAPEVLQDDLLRTIATSCWKAGTREQAYALIDRIQSDEIRDSALASMARSYAYSHGDVGTVIEVLTRTIRPEMKFAGGKGALQHFLKQGNRQDALELAREIDQQVGNVKLQLLVLKDMFFEAGNCRWGWCGCSGQVATSALNDPRAQDLRDQIAQLLHLINTQAQALKEREGPPHDELSSAFSAWACTTDSESSAHHAIERALEHAAQISNFQSRTQRMAEIAVAYANNAKVTAALELVYGATLDKTLAAQTLARIDVILDLHGSRESRSDRLLIGQIAYEFKGL